MLTALIVAACTVAAQPDADALRGPDVPEHKTIVRYGMNDDFRRVEGRPEAVALQLLDLDPETREHANTIVEQRAADVAVMLVDRIDTIREMTDESLAGNADRAAELMRELYIGFQPDQARDPLLAPLAGVLDDEQLAELERMLDEYWSAWVASEIGATATDEQRAQGERRLAFQLFQEEVRRGYEVSLRRYKQAMDAVYEAVQPTDEQRAGIRGIIIEHIKTTRLKATPAQRRETMMQIYRLLDDERREKLFAYMTRVVIPDG